MRIAALIVVVGLSWVVAGCGGGGGGGGDSGATTITGTAAIVAPLTAAEIAVKCRVGNGTATTDATGRFSIALQGASGSCLLKATGQGQEIVSVTHTPSGNANVTPLTHLLAARLLAAAAPVATFQSPAAAAFDLITEQGIAAAQGQVTAEIARIGGQMPAANWVTQAFTAAQGDAMDGALETLTLTLQQQGKTFADATTEVASGPLQNVKPPPTALNCKPGLIAGFSGATGDALSSVVSGGGDSPGGIGGAGDGSDGSAGGVGVGGSLGQFRAVDVTVEFAGGRVFGPLRLDSPDGMITLVPCELAPPVLVTFEGKVGSGAVYFDEKTRVEVSFVGKSLQSVLTRLDRNGGVTPFTDAMVQRTLQLGNVNAATGGTRFKAIEKAADAWKDAARVQVAHDEVAGAVNDLLPGIYRLEDLRRRPVVVGSIVDNSGKLTDDQNGVYGAVLAGLANAAGLLQPTSTSPALDIQRQFVDDLTDGVRNLRQGSGASTTAVGKATYDYATLANRLSVETGKIASAIGAGGLKTRRTPVQKMRAKSGTDFSSAPNWNITLFSDGKLEAVRIGAGAGAPALPTDERFVRIDVFDRSTRTFANTSSGAWQNCLVATAANGLNIYTWKVGLAGAQFVVKNVGSATDPILSASPESLAAATQGGDSVMLSRSSGAATTLEACDDQDFHPGMATPAAGRYIVQSLQDFGNRYFVYSDGTVEAWGIAKQALGVGQTATGSLQPENKLPLLLTGVSMLARGTDLQQTRGLVRSSDPAKDGTVHVWGAGLPSPRQITGLPKVCYIAGPYVVGCGGQLFHVTTTVVAGANITATSNQVATVPAIWRVMAEYPKARNPTTVPIDPNTNAPDEDTPTTSLTLSYLAIGQNGTTWRLTDATAVTAD